MNKVLIILFAEPGNHESIGRALHALLYAKELEASGVEAKVMFDGGGTKWVPEMSNPSHMLNPLFLEVLGKGIFNGGICDYCTGAFKADREAIAKTGIPVRSDNGGHPPIAEYIKNGYQIITL